jgi:23S rRNA pseudouridine1911/1915/1917 synthase
VVVAEDAAFLVLDKPAGLPCHPLRAAERETLVNALVARHPEVLGVGYRRREAGLVHRLDNHTSGVVLVARRADAFATLRAALQDGRMQKRYRAVIRGPYRGPEVIDIRLASDPADPRRVVPVEGPKRHRRRHRTHVEAVERHGPLSLLTVDAPVAGRHQIRAHLAAVGHPLVGDWLYGGPPGAAHHLLHASSIAFAHPDDPSTPVVVHAPLPAPWTRLLRMASGSRPG